MGDYANFFFKFISVIPPKRKTEKLGNFKCTFLDRIKIYTKIWIDEYVLFPILLIILFSETREVLKA